MTRFKRFISSGCGSGYFPKASGTIGSIAALAVWYFLIPISVWSDPLISTAIVLAITLLGIVSISGVAEGDDPAWIVIDEWAGMLLALVPLGDKNWLLALSALALFRFFDIVKPGPIAQLEKLPGAWGIMADDLLAGLAAAICLWLGLKLL